MTRLHRELKDKFIDKIREAGSNILSPDSCMKIFGNIEQLLVLNGTLLSDLKKDMNEGEGKLGRVLLKFSPFLKMYSTYVDGYDNAMIILNDELQRG